MLVIGILASHSGSNMQAILDRIADGSLAARVGVVISNNSGSGALERARKAGVPWLHISAATHGGPGGEDSAIRHALAEAGCELVCLAGYMKKIGPETLAAYSGRILNIHPALLPRHGGPGMYGLRPHEAAIAAGDTESGATVHLVDGEYDRGRILRQVRVPILPGDTPQSLQQRVLVEEHKLYPAALASIIAGDIEM